MDCIPEECCGLRWTQKIRKTKIKNTWNDSSYQIKFNSVFLLFFYNIDIKILLILTVRYSEHL